MSLPKGIFWKTHNDQKILVNDYRGLSDEEMLTMVQNIEQIMLTEMPQARLVHGNGGELPMAVRVFIGKMGPRIKHIPCKVAVLHTPTAKRLLLQSYNRIIGGQMRFFDTEEEALKYLTK